MDQKTWNRDYASGLRQLADWYERNAAEPWLFATEERLLCYQTTAERFKAAVKSLGAVTKTMEDFYACADKDFGPLKLHVYTIRENVCRQIKVGTKVIPQQTVEAIEAQPEKIIPAHEEPVYKWDCSPFLGESREGTEDGAGADDEDHHGNPDQEEQARDSSGA